MGLVDEPFVYVTTIGRKSGQPRPIEIWFVLRGGRIYILAEHGLRTHWVANILENPHVTIRLAAHSFDATARVLDREHDGPLWVAVQDLAREKYGWADGLPVEILPDVPMAELS
jgi:deazaflavin-dependent oxidoreductase (nitroreductase family)